MKPSLTSSWVWARLAGAMAALAFWCCMAVAADPETVMDRRFEAASHALEARATAADQRLARQWRAAVAADEARWEALQRAVEAKWDTFVGATRTEWVEYGLANETRSRVDYDKGTMSIEVLIPAGLVPREPGSTQLPKEAWDRIATALERVARPEPVRGLGPIEGQLRTRAGVPVTPENARAYARDELIPRAVVAPGVIEGKDGVARRKVRVETPLVENHMLVRARRFRGLVVEEARKYDLDPQLVFAVIETESRFNPRARSPVPAYGLMQLVPRWGAMDAYEYLFGDKRLLDAEYLYVPENNVRLGAAYLHLLLARYLTDVDDPDKRLLLAVAGYNWGPGAVRRGIMDKVDVARLSLGQLRHEVDRRAPRETRGYVRHVFARSTQYAELARL